MSPSLIAILLFVGAVIVHRALTKQAWERLDESTRRRISDAQAAASGVRSLGLFLGLVLAYTMTKSRWPESPWPSLGFVTVLLVLFVGASLSQLSRLTAAQAPPDYLRAVRLGKGLLAIALLVLFVLVLVRGRL